MMFSLAPSSPFLAFLQPRKLRYRSTFAILTVLLCLIIFVSFVRPPSLTPSHDLRQKHTSAAHQIAEAPGNAHNFRIYGEVGLRKHGQLHHKGHSLKLDPAQELAAISSFLASLSQNIIPLSVDPSVSIDPQLVLDFGTHGVRAAEELQHMVNDVWSRNPIFLYSKVSIFLLLYKTLIGGPCSFTLQPRVKLKLY